MRVHRFADLPDELRAEIASGKTSGLLCPMCNGGRTGERSLSYGAARLTCFRAGCGYSARVFGDGVNLEPPKFKKRVYEGELCATELCDNLTSVLQIRYQLNDETITRFTRAAPTTGKEGALYMPVLSPTGAERGGMMRYFDGTQPKVVSYKQTDQPWQAWYSTHYGDYAEKPTVIVEDQLSAMRCWQLDYHTVALLGTNLNTEKAAEIRQEAPGAVLLALDKDAWPNALKYARKYPWLTPILLERDLKDCDDEEIQRRLG